MLTYPLNAALAYLAVGCFLVGVLMDADVPSWSTRRRYLAVGIALLWPLVLVVAALVGTLLSGAKVGAWAEARWGSRTP